VTSAIGKYWRRYKWANIREMLTNMRRPPLVNSAQFKDKLVVITGATAGIGYFTARKYAAMGAHVLMINRNLEKSERVRREIAAEFGTQVDHFIADLSLLEDIQRAGQHLLSLSKPIDVLIHNAGVHLETRQETKEGLEVNFVVHYLCPLLMTRMILPKYRLDKAGRVIFVSSEAYRFAAWGLLLDDLQWLRRRYTGIAAYGAGKLASILSMHMLAKELAPFNVTLNAMHPGMVRTESGKNNGRFYQWHKRNFIDKYSGSAESSAEALYYLGTAPEVANVSDVFFHMTTTEELTPPAQDLQAAEELWDATWAMLKDRGIVLDA